MSGSRAKKERADAPDRVFAHLILSVEILKPDDLDIASYQHSFWPGEMVMDRHDYGTVPTVVDYPDGAITFRCTIMRLIIGELQPEGMKMDPRYDPLIRQLRAGLQVEQFADQVAVELADAVKTAIEDRWPIDDRAKLEPLLAQIDVLRQSTVRGVRQRG